MSCRTRESNLRSATSYRSTSAQCERFESSRWRSSLFNKMTIQIRIAQVEDAQAIARVHIESWRAAYAGLMPASVLDALDLRKRTEQWKLHLASPVIAVFVGIENGEVVGFSSMRPTRDDGDAGAIAEIPAIYLLRSQWRAGIGRLLCERTLVEARTRGFDEVTLWVLDTNERAIRFYERLGFRSDGELKVDTQLTGSPLSEVRYRISTPLGRD